MGTYPYSALVVEHERCGNINRNHDAVLEYGITIGMVACIKLDGAIYLQEHTSTIDTIQGYIQSLSLPHIAP